MVRNYITKVTEHSNIIMKNQVAQGGDVIKTKESLNFKTAINKYNIKLTELRKKMQNEATENFGPIKIKQADNSLLSSISIINIIIQRFIKCTSRS